MNIASHGHMAEKRDFVEHVCLFLGASKEQMCMTGSISLNSLICEMGFNSYSQGYYKNSIILP